MENHEEYVKAKKDEFRWFFDKAIGILGELGDSAPWAAVVLCGQAFDVLGKKFKQVVAQDAAMREPSSIEQKVKIAFIEHGTSGAEIARKTGVDRTAIYKTIEGKIRAYRLRKAIADAIGVGIEDLWPSDGNGENPPLTPPKRGIINKSERN